MGDILNKEGYQQVFLCGSEGDFAGRDTYFTSHKDFHIEDYNAAKKRRIHCAGLQSILGA